MGGARTIRWTGSFAASCRNDDSNCCAANWVVFDTIQKLENDAVQTIESTGSDGHVYIRDGVLVAAGRPSPLLHRCRN
jgi:hypothetical protein